MANLLKGNVVASAIREDVKQRTAALKQKGVAPCLCVLQVDDSADSSAYARSLKKACDKLEIEMQHILLPESCSEQQVSNEILSINNNKNVHGCLILQPLPKHISADVCRLLVPSKDVDGSTPASRLVQLDNKAEGFLPCTPEACVAILDYYGIETRGKRAAVIGRSSVVGLPLSLMLTAKDATVTICHSKTTDTAAICRESDILVAAAGRAQLVDESYAREGQTVLDVGIHEAADGGLCGDVNFAAVEGIVDAITPVPGGVGSVTTAIMLRHVIEAAEKAALSE